MRFDNVLAKPKEFFRITRGTRKPDQELPFGIEEKKCGRCAYTIVQKREICFGDFLTIKARHQSVTVGIKPDQSKVLSKIILHLRLIEYCLLHSITPGTIVSLKYHQHTDLALVLSQFSFLREIIETVLKEELGRIPSLAGG
tara:strand:- start:4 stop:429 length:426 start_codon:yes stop_codon:yes gene_type:complete